MDYRLALLREYHQAGCIVSVLFIPLYLWLKLPSSVSSIWIASNANDESRPFHSLHALNFFGSTSVGEKKVIYSTYLLSYDEIWGTCSNLFQASDRFTFAILTILFSSLTCRLSNASVFEGSPITVVLYEQDWMCNRSSTFA